MFQPKDKTKPFLLLVAGMLLSMGIHAEETRWYDVEVILLAQKSQDYRNSEHWPADYSQPKLEGSRELLSSATRPSRNGEPVAFRRLSSSELKMRADAGRIKRASDLELLAHFGWRQPGLAEERAIPVHISDKLLARPAPEELGQMQELNGTLTLILSRYLHVKADLLYREPTDESAGGYAQTIVPTDSMDAQAGQGKNGYMLNQASPAPQQSRYQVYRLQQSVRMRSGETHYMDHPVFGVVVQVRPVGQ